MAIQLTRYDAVNTCKSTPPDARGATGRMAVSCMYTHLFISLVLRAWLNQSIDLEGIVKTIREMEKGTI
ncbi:MAG TPA: hypothetical protein V6C69_17105 [Trichormus sp.]